MQQEQTPSPFPTRAWWHEVSTPARVAFVCGVPVAFGLVMCDEIFGDAIGPEHPLGIARLSFRLGCFAACGVMFAIAGVGTFRARRVTTRLRQGLCPACGYDLRAASDRCPECGSPSPTTSSQ